MIIENRGETFEVLYGGEVYKIKKGKSEIVNEGFANHILFKASRKGADIVRFADSEKIEVKDINEIEEEIVEEASKEETPIKEELTSKKTTNKKK